VALLFDPAVYQHFIQINLHSPGIEVSAMPTVQPPKPDNRTVVASLPLFRFRWKPIKIVNMGKRIEACKLLVWVAEGWRKGVSHHRTSFSLLASPQLLLDNCWRSLQGESKIAMRNCSHRFTCSLCYTGLIVLSVRYWFCFWCCFQSIGRWELFLPFFCIIFCICNLMFLKPALYSVFLYNWLTD
jgi:hypothetical protein